MSWHQQVCEGATGTCARTAGARLAQRGDGVQRVLLGRVQIRPRGALHHRREAAHHVRHRVQLAVLHRCQNRPLRGKFTALSACHDHGRPRTMLVSSIPLQCNAKLLGSINGSVSAWRAACKHRARVVGAEEEVEDVGVAGECAHDLHHVDALPQRARGRHACGHTSQVSRQGPEAVSRASKPLTLEPWALLPPCAVGFQPLTRAQVAGAGNNAMRGEPGAQQEASMAAASERAWRSAACGWRARPGGAYPRGASPRTRRTWIAADGRSSAARCARSAARSAGRSPAAPARRPGPADSAAPSSAACTRAPAHARNISPCPLHPRRCAVLMWSLLTPATPHASCMPTWRALSPRPCSPQHTALHVMGLPARPLQCMPYKERQKQEMAARPLSSASCMQTMASMQRRSQIRRSAAPAARARRRAARGRRVRCCPARSRAGPARKAAAAPARAATPASPCWLRAHAASWSRVTRVTFSTRVCHTSPCTGVVITDLPASFAGKAFIVMRFPILGEANYICSCRAGRAAGQWQQGRAGPAAGGTCEHHAQVVQQLERRVGGAVLREHARGAARAARRPGAACQRALTREGRARALRRGRVGGGARVPLAPARVAQVYVLKHQGHRLPRARRRSPSVSLGHRTAALLTGMVLNSIAGSFQMWRPEIDGLTTLRHVHYGAYVCDHVLASVQEACSTHAGLACVPGARWQRLC